MDNITDCGKSQHLMMKYMDGTITDGESLLLFSHASGCAGCKEDLALYQGLLASFSETVLADAPEGFQCAVMARIVLLPNPYHEDENHIDTLLCVVWGSFSVLSGTGMLLFINRDSLKQWAMSDPLLAEYLNAVTPLADASSAAVARMVQLLQAGMDTFVTYASSVQIVLAAIFSVLALVQYFVYRKDRINVKI